MVVLQLATWSSRRVEDEEDEQQQVAATTKKRAKQQRDCREIALGCCERASEVGYCSSVPEVASPKIHSLYSYL